MTEARARPAVFISAPIAALVEGIYRADTTVAQLKTKGDFGIGTFNDLDGEMVFIDGVVYCLRPEGAAEIVSDQTRTPFAVATSFDGDTRETIARRMGWEELERTILDLIPSKNLLYAIRIEGAFDHVRARSVPRQSSYRPLAEIAKVQTIFEYRDIRGTIVGFFTPSFLESVHLPGLHLHFISADRTRGGHLLAAAPREIEVALQHAPAVELGLPLTLDFLTMERTRDMQADLAKVER
jgi:acetolactate decarboxylase